MGQGDGDGSSSSNNANSASGGGVVTPTVRAATGIPVDASVAIVPVRGEIYEFPQESFERRVEEALDRGAEVIVVELDTPGGLAMSTIAMSKFIRRIEKPTVAWINDDAYSAGSVLAVACDQIVMSPASTIGDTAPIVPGMGSLSSTERDKMLKPLLEVMTNSALHNGYDYAVLEAMCTHGPQVYLIENDKTGERRAVNQVDYAIMVNADDPNSVVTKMKQQLDKLFSSDHYHQPNSTVARPGDEGQWKPVTTVGQFHFPEGLVHDGKSLLTIGEAKAVAIGLAQDGDIRNDDDLRKYLDAADTFRVNQHWVESVAYWLTRPLVRAFLILLMLIFGFIEMQAPGLGWAGGIALVCLIALIGAPFLIGLAKVWHLLLVLVGILLILGEVFITPGFGVLGISGLIAVLAGLVLAVVPTEGDNLFTLPGRESLGYLQGSILWTLLGLMLSGVAFFFLTKHFGSVPGLNRLVLRDPPPAAATAGTPVSGHEDVGDGKVAVGDTGKVVVDCRPSGRVRFESGEVVDVIAVGRMLETGQRVVAIDVSGNRVVVETDRGQFAKRAAGADDESSDGDSTA